MTLTKCWPNNIVAIFVVITSLVASSCEQQSEDISDTKTSVLKLGQLIEMKDQRYEVVAKSTKEEFEYLVTEKELWLYTVGKISQFEGTEPQSSEFTHKIQAAAGDTVRIVPSEPSIQVNGAPMEFYFSIMESMFKKFKDMPMALMEKQMQ